MGEKKNTAYARVHIAFDGRVNKWFLGPKAQERYANEVQVLRYLEKKKCTFVPRLLSKDDSEFKIETTNCGQMVRFDAGAQHRLGMQMPRCRVLCPLPFFGCEAIRRFVDRRSR